MSGTTGNRNAAKKLPELALTLAESERRAAWAEHGAEMMAAFFARPQHPTVRPEAWWQYTEGIPPRLRRLPEWPDDHPAPWEVEEPVKCARAAWLARNGHLTADELADLAADTSEDTARLRAAVKRALAHQEGRSDRASEPHSRPPGAAEALQPLHRPARHPP
jgi:hypothetical protein